MTDSALDRLEAALSAIAAKNSEWSIVTAMDAKAAREAAKASDRRRRSGQALGPLDGRILGIKDNIAVAGLPWTGGLGARRDETATEDAPVVASLRAAGAIPLAMLNMHEGALGATTDNPHFGRAANPLDPNRTPGGSSGGSGAALAAGFADISLGTDTMGSVRIPAAYCGVAGLKPTHGLIPRAGLLYLSPTLDTIGPLARDVATLGAMTQAMAGVDRRDPLSRPLPKGWSPTATDTIPHDLKVGIPQQIKDVDCEVDVLAGLMLASRVLEAAGATVTDVDLSGWHPGPARRGGLLVSEAEGAVQLADTLDRPGADLMSDTLRSLLAYGRDLPSARMVEGYARVQAAAAAAERALSEVDVLLMPTAPQRAFRHADPVPANQADLTALANFHGGPALALPVPGDPLPTSVQILGPAFSESLVLTLGRVLERGFGA